MFQYLKNSLEHFHYFFLLLRRYLYSQSHDLANIRKKIKSSTFRMFFFIDYLEREERKERGKQKLMWERSICWLHTRCAPSRDRTWDLGMHPDCKSNLRPFGAWEDASINWATPVRVVHSFYFCLFGNGAGSCSLPQTWELCSTNAHTAQTNDRRTVRVALAICSAWSCILYNQKVCKCWWSYKASRPRVEGRYK